MVASLRPTSPRSKIGLGAKRTKDVLGSYDAVRGVLTVVQFDLPEGKTDYVNSMWEKQARPYGGDVVNSYNDGPNDKGESLGPFYELETSSPAAALGPGDAMTHRHRTAHFVGTEDSLEAVALKTLGVGLAAIRSALPE